MTGLLDTLETDMLEKLLRKQDVISLILSRGKGEVLSWIQRRFERKDVMPDNSIEPHRPSLNELSFRELMLGDEETMSYNNAWGGTVPFPMEDWADWYDHWIVNTADKRFYRYIKDSSTGEFIGEIAYHYDEGRQIHIADVIVFSPYRNRGYGSKALKLLCMEAAERGVDVLYDDIAIDNPGISIFLREGFTEEYRTDEIIMLRKDLRA
ncbi:MAG: GNAT family N-acetyltransferase [Oscillospiraceae bacterium]|nr:GNAT family N-acetyltransferase [Oscillospiraceae bacterium]